MPVVATLDLLDEEALVRILKEPKNSLVRQYKHLFELDDVILEFEDDTLREIAKKAISRNVGARGLRSIMEEIMMDIMYEIPSNDKIEKVIITKECLKDVHSPILSQ